MQENAPTNATRSHATPIWLWLLVAALLFGIVGFWLQARAYPKRFGVVVPGLLFRSGEVQPHHLSRLKEEFGITTVLSLLDPDAPESIAERKAAKELNIRFLNVPLRGNGASTREDRDQIREYVCDPSNQPLLVHCSAGANRTGLTIGMYRMHVNGWNYEAVLKEMKTYDFEDEPHHENLRAALREEQTLIDYSRVKQP